MMLRLFFVLMALAVGCLQGNAQFRYEQWIDGNRSSIQRGSLTLGEQTVTVDLNGMPYPGLHFLNILPYDESGETGVWRSIAFLVPECWPEVSEAVQMEYWVTGYDSRPRYKAYDGTAVALDIDASGYSPGLHFLNYRTLNAKGERGAWKVIAFMLPECWPDASEAVQMEYWVTGYDSHPRYMAYDGTAVTFDIDISQMSYGLHFLNYRTMNEKGEYGAWKQIRFYVDNGIFDAEEIDFDYWIDDGNALTGKGMMPGIVTLQMDISGLEEGEHTFSFKARNSFGDYGNLFAVPFELSDSGDILGDVNKDGTVNVSDVLQTVNHILEVPMSNFYAENADINGDELINVADVMGIVRIILTSPSGAPAWAQQAEKELVCADATESGYVMRMGGEENLAACQMSIELPVGSSIHDLHLAGSAAKTHRIMSQRGDGNRWQVVVFSLDGHTLIPGEDLLQFSVDNGQGGITVTGVQFADSRAETILSPDLSAVPTGISGTVADKINVAPAYNASGQHVRASQRGLVIRNGRKVVVR